MPQRLLQTNGLGTANLVQSGNGVGSVDATTLTLHLTKLDIDVHTPMMDATPEILDASSNTENHIVMRHTGKVTGKVVFAGYVKNGLLVGLNSLPIESARVQFFLGKQSAFVGLGETATGHSLKFRVAVTNVKLLWSKGVKDMGVQVQITARITGSYSDTITDKGVLEELVTT